MMDFKDYFSGSESEYSLDSLEGETHIKSETRISTNTLCLSDCSAKCKNTTVPYYTGEIPVQNITSSNNCQGKIANNSENEPGKGTPQRSSSYMWNDKPSRQQNNKRISRRKELIILNKNSLRARHRSVSYLEQFKKKNYGNNNLDHSNCSITGSTLPDRDKSLSIVSFLSEESRMSMSELDFYDELMLSPHNELKHEPTLVSPLWSKGSLQSSTLVTDKSEESAKSSKNSKPNKVKAIVLSRIEAVIPDKQKFDLDKKKSLERRELYAANVKLRNQIKINRQKEKDKKNKFNESGVISNCSFEVECLLSPQAKNICPLTFDTSKTSSSHPTNNVKCQQHIKNERKLPASGMQKAQRRGIQKGQNKKSKPTAELASLQERHEREKSLIESMKNLILKT